jgi:biopolymer transport protein ExbD
MIDIMLVLLIIFMIVTPVITSGFTARIPEGRNIERAEEADGDVTLGIDDQGQYYLDPGTGQTTAIVNDSLTSFLTRVYSSPGIDKVLYFKADAGLPYSVIEEALESAREAGVAVLATIAEQPREERRR